MKLVFFMAAIIFTVFYGWAALGGVGAINPIVIVWLLLFWLAGALLSKTIVWGGLFGVLPAANFIYMGTQETGQVINETPMGIVVLAFYLLCCIYVFHKKKKAPK